MPHVNSILLTTFSLLASEVNGAEGASVHRRMAERRLPQHRVRSPKRQVPYPDDHPLERHLKNVHVGHDEDFNDLYYNVNVVGGDGWSGREQELRRRRRRHQVDDSRQSRLLHFIYPPSRLQNTQRSNVDDILSPQAEEAEQLREGGGTVRYWTVTGRNLVNSIANEPAEGSNFQLLVNASSLDRDMTYGNATRDESQQNTTIEEGTNELYQNDDSVDGYGLAVEQDLGANKSQYVLPNISSTTIIKEEGRNNETTSSTYQPIRLRAILTDDDSSGSKYLTALQRKILMEDMINPALYAWSKALHVVPVGRDGSTGNLVVDSSQLYDGVSCGPGLDSGLPSVRVPQEHMKEGVSDTDTVIYISVSFTEKAMPLGPVTRSAPFLKVSNRNIDDFIEDAENQTEAPSLAPSDSPSMSPSETEPFVESRPHCPGTYLASATYCSSDQYDRPVAGILSICISDVQTFFLDKNQIKRNIVTIMHEMGHILGFNAQSLAHFRDGDTGEPLTARDKNGDVPDIEVECTGVHPLTKSKIPLPSSNITTFKSVRGGVRVATIVTPTVRRVARNMFGCQSLNGAELESGEWQLFAADDVDDLSPGECIGDHWERRLFRTDLLNPMMDDVPYSLYISSLTLSFFADSGWYKVDTQRIAPSSIWGRNAGCNFVNQKCITRDGQVTANNNAFFCNNFISSKSNINQDSKLDIHGCDLDSSSKAVCSIVEYDLELPDEYNYFGNTKLVGGDFYGGIDPTLDYCPVFQGYSNGLCGSESSEKYVGVKKSLEVFGEGNSRCVIGNVDRKRTALCLPMACVIQDQTLMIKVDGYWKSCLYAGQIISVWWNRKDYVVCPDPSHLCPTFYCPNDCFGDAGICDYRSGQCLCTPLAKMNSNSSSSWLSNYYSTPLLEPCSGDQLNNRVNGSYHIAERIDVELPEYYVDNTTLLLDDPRDFDDKVSRMFAQLSSGEVVGLVASFMLFVMFSYLIWYQLMECYKRRLLGSPLSKVRSGVSSLSGLLRNLSHASLDNHGGNDTMDLPPCNRRQPGQGRSSQKDKMVATLLVHNRIESTMIAQRREQQTRLQLAGIEASTEQNSTEQATIIELSSPSDQPTLVYRSELPPLPEGGRVLAVLGAHIVEDDENVDTRSTVTSATHVTNRTMAAEDDTSIYTSPLYHDEESEPQRGVQRYLRLRHGSHIRQIE
ncbi:hypothetical protein HJC23_002367 [Cyclotella cryptica]|uniref:Leishmanolysin-like peptidase n=1 Tax=Cyclotella cryptica TaxID=29204 RepID=A0ABD3QM47_9STRA|eukprot:CCRYP_004475-RA/>CCRYP_004475-RA protein AED:0.00 eAED:0.00 QI:156/1/1/1/1/1/2/245/1185